MSKDSDPSALDATICAWQTACSKQIHGQAELLSSLFVTLKYALASPTIKCPLLIFDGPLGAGKTHITSCLARCSPFPWNVYTPDYFGISSHLRRDEDAEGQPSLRLLTTEEILEPLDVDYHEQVSKMFRFGSDAKVSILVIEEMHLMCKKSSDNDKSASSSNENEAKATVTTEEGEEILEALLAHLNNIHMGDRRIIILMTCRKVDELPPRLLERRLLTRHFPIQTGQVEQRLALLEHFYTMQLRARSKGWSLPDPETLLRLAQKTSGYSPRDLCSIVNSPLDPFDLLLTMKPSILRHANTDIPSYSTSSLIGMDPIIRACKQLLAIPHDPRMRRFRVPHARGILLHGPPGSGKTHLAMSLASESGLNFHYMEASALRSKYYGESEKKISETFEMARHAAPCILILDHIESILPNRFRSAEGGGATETSSTEMRIMTTFLTELDGITTLSHKYPVTVIAMTSDRGAVDPALLRPGRLEFHFGMPGELSSQDTMDYFQRVIPSECLGVDAHVLGELLQASGPLTGSELSFVWREAALNAIRTHDSGQGQGGETEVTPEGLAQMRVGTGRPRDGHHGRQGPCAVCLFVIKHGAVVILDPI